MHKTQTAPRSCASRKAHLRQLGENHRAPPGPAPHTALTTPPTPPPEPPAPPPGRRDPGAPGRWRWAPPLCGTWSRRWPKWPNWSAALPARPTSRWPRMQWPRCAPRQQNCASRSARSPPVPWPRSSDAPRPPAARYSTKVQECRSCKPAGTIFWPAFAPKNRLPDPLYVQKSRMHKSMMVSVWQLVNPWG